MLRINSALYYPQPCKNCPCGPIVCVHGLLFVDGPKWDSTDWPLACTGPVRVHPIVVALIAVVGG